MNIKYSAIIGILAAGLMAAPALAGSVGVTGGTVENKTLDISTRSYTATVTGTLHLTGVWGTGHGFNGGKRVYYSGKLNTDYSNPSSDPNVANHIKAAENAVDTAARNSITEGGRGTYNGRTMSTSSKKTDNRYTYVTVDNSQALVVGDEDAYKSGYVAQGTQVRTTVTAGNLHEDFYYRVKGTGVVSPIILDLDGDGKIEASHGKYLPHTCDFSSGETKAVMFDFYGNGFPVAMEWVGSNDGLLCRPEADGTVTGANLFGVANGHDNGYDELAALDINRDGVLEGDELEGLSVWTDKNVNGVAEKGELSTVQELGITSIGVNHKEFKSSFTRNGKEFMSVDWWPCMMDVRKVEIKKI